MLTRLPLFHSNSGRHALAPHISSGPSNATTAGIALVACTFLAIGLGVQPSTADSADAAEPAGAATDTAASVPANIVLPAPELAKRPVAVAAPAVASGPVTGGTVVTVSGEELTKVSAVQVGGVPATVVESTATTLSYLAPVSTEHTTGTVSVELFDVTGAAVPVATEAEVAMAAVEPVTVPLAPSPTSSLLRAVLAKPASVTATAATASAPIASTAMLSFEYLPDPRVAAQTDYVLRHWQNYNPEFTAIHGNDCVNFTSQGLLARGWQMDGEWSYNGGAGSSAWVSSTAFHNYMASHPERGSYLDDSQRASVKVGDIAQFDWDGSGDRDHTSTVTRVDKTENGVVIYVAGHSKDSDFWNVDQAIAGGGAVSYWSLT